MRLGIFRVVSVSVCCVRFQTSTDIYWQIRKIAGLLRSGEGHAEVQLTGVGDGNPLVELVVIRHSVKLAAQHLSERGLVVGTGFGVARAVALPLPRAVLAAKLRPV